MKYLVQFILFISLLTVQLIFFNPVHAKDVHLVFKKLVKRLHIDGMEEKYLKDLFTHPELELMSNAVAMSLIRKEANLNYAQFLTKYSVDQAISYLKTHNRTLKRWKANSVSPPL